MEIWGNAGWKFSHIITFAYPDTPTDAQKQSALNYFQSFSDILPCGKCQTHYREMIAKNPPPVDSMDQLSRWFVNLHNQVNMRLGKPTMTYEEAKELYTKRPEMKKPKQKWTLWILILIVIIAVVIAFTFFKKKNNLKKPVALPPDMKKVSFASTTSSK